MLLDVRREGLEDIVEGVNPFDLPSVPEAVISILHSSVWLEVLTSPC